MCDLLIISTIVNLRSVYLFIFIYKFTVKTIHYNSLKLLNKLQILKLDLCVTLWQTNKTLKSYLQTNELSLFQNSCHIIQLYHSLIRNAFLYRCIMTCRMCVTDKYGTLYNPISLTHLLSKSVVCITII